MSSKHEVCFSVTRGLCNVCGALADAKIVFRDGRVYLVKGCLEHGRTEALICSDQEWYLRSIAYIKPGTAPLQRAVEAFSGCPGSCGLCPEHQQHSCVPILEITDRCDLDCPVCLVAPGQKRDLSLSEIGSIVDALTRYEGRINMLTLSGGEPTLHPQLLEVVDRLRRPEIGIISLSTNGLSLLRNPALLKGLKDRGVVISLQFDGWNPDTYATLRGRADLAEKKRQIIEKVLELDMQLSLTVTLARGVNEQALEAALDLLFNQEQVVSIMVQPAAYAGHAASRLTHDPLDVLTIPDVVNLLAASSSGVLEVSDFTPLPCSHPSCFALTYLLKLEDGRLLPLPRIFDAESYLDIIKNQALMGTDMSTLYRVRDALYGLWTSNGIVPDRDAVLKTVKRLLLNLNALGREASHREVLDLGVRTVKSIFIHHFMDRFTFDQSRVVKCCNHYPQTDGRLLPVCVRNNLKWSL